MRVAATTPLPHVHLLAGQLLITCEPQIVVTVLGSCVSLTLFAREARLAAICHAALVGPRGSAQLSASSRDRYRFVELAVPAMLAAYRRADIPAAAIEAKLFGGADVIGHGTAAGSGRVGAENVAAIRRLLAAAGIPLAAENTLGQRGRKILFNTATGEVLHKRLHRSTP